MTKAKAFLCATVTACLLASGAAAAKGPGDKMGGRSPDHMSDQGSTNSNPQHDPESTRGMDRANDRMNEKGREKKRGHPERTAKDKRDPRKRR